jgi:hypothetical protein
LGPDQFSIREDLDLPAIFAAMGQARSRLDLGLMKLPQEGWSLDLLEDRMLKLDQVVLKDP